MDWAFFSVFLFSILPQAVALSLELSAIVLPSLPQAAASSFELLAVRSAAGSPFAPLREMIWFVWWPTKN
jgi:hypothetical protein